MPPGRAPESYQLTRSSGSPLAVSAWSIRPWIRPRWSTVTLRRNDVPVTRVAAGGEEVADIDIDRAVGPHGATCHGPADRPERAPSLAQGWPRGTDVDGCGRQP